MLRIVSPAAWDRAEVGIDKEACEVAIAASKCRKIVRDPPPTTIAPCWVLPAATLRQAVDTATLRGATWQVQQTRAPY